MRATLYIWLFLHCTSVFAQRVDKINCQSLYTDAGLSQSSVLAIEQDRYGFIWLGTRDGLNLYDGSKVQVYKNIPGDEKSLSGNLINDITEGEAGNLWVAHDNGVSLFERHSGIFKHFKVNANNKEIRSITVLKDKVWACGWDGLFVLDGDSVFNPYTTNNNSSKLSLSTSKIFEAPSKEGYWVATTNNGLCYLDNAKRKIKKIFEGKDENIRVEDILFHPNGKMYIGTYGKGLLECDARGRILKRWNKDNTNGQFRINNIRALTVDHQGVIWIGGFQGLATLDPASGQINRLTPVHAIWEVNDISIRSLYKDKNGSIWIGSYHNGALLYDDYFSRFTTNPLRLSDEKPIYGIVSAFALSSTGKVHITTENGYLFELPDYRNPSVNKVLYHPKEGNNPVFKSLYYDEKRDQLWIGTLRDGLFVKNKNRLSRVLLSPEHSNRRDTINYGVINNMISYDDKHVWLLTDKQGALQLLDIDKQRLVDFPASRRVSELVERSGAKHIVRLRDDSFLLGTKGAGLVYFDNTENGEIKKVLPQAENINHVAVHRDRIYVSTQGNGLFILDSFFNIVRHYTTNDDLINNVILSTIPDDKGNLWVYTFNGINLIKSNGNISAYDSKNGFQLAEVNAWQHLIDEDNKIVFFAGGKDTWVSFSPHNVPDNTYIPKVYLTSVKLANKTISDLKFLNGKVDGEHGLILKSDESLLTIEFSGTNYLMPENSRFRYVMDGYDTEWIYTDHQGIARYNKLPAGKYTFKVQASNNDGVWSDNVAELSIRKMPPLWLSWKAFVLYILMASTFFYYYRKNEIKKIKLKQQLHYKEAEKHRIAEDHASKIKYFNDISHEIRTPLTLLLHPMEELMENDTLSSKDKHKILSMQYHGKNLLLLVNQLLEINRLELKKESLNTTPTFLKELISIIDNSFQPIAKESGVHWEVDITEMTEEALEIDRQQVEKVLLNLLTNAFKFTPKGGAVQLIVNTLPSKDTAIDLWIKVVDNGIGISEKDLPHIFERLYKGNRQNNINGSGIGLALVKAIVEDLMKGTIQVISTSGRGTTFDIVIPNIAVVQHKTVEKYKENLLTPDYLHGLLESTNDESLPIQDDNTKKKSILLVEDNILLSKMLTENLIPHYKIYNKTTAEEAIGFLKEHEIDLILSDVMLPKMSGKDFCVEVKSNIITSHIPFVLLTAIDGDESRLAGLELGADDYLTKPFILKELLLRISNILKQRERWKNYISDRHNGIKPDTRLNKYDEILIKNIDNRLEDTLDDTSYTVEDLSKDIGLSRVHLFRKLKALTGLSPSQYIRNYKLNKARSIIEREEIRVADLAYKVGFQDPNYFLKCFKEKFGCSPTEFVKRFSS